MPNGLIPSSDAVRRRVSLVLVAYCLPMVAVAIVLAVSADRRPLILLLSCLVLGAIVSLLRWQWQRRQERRSTPKPLPAAARHALLARFPELAALTMVWKGGGDLMTIDGRVLTIRFDLLEYLLQGTPLSRTTAFLVGHEARHWAVGASHLLASFRLLLSAYTLVAGVVFGSLLLNVAAIFDDADRFGLIVAILLGPSVVALVQAALRRADGALVWWLEVDADRSSLARLDDEAAAAAVQKLISDHTVGLQAEHIPGRLRRAAITQRSAARTIGATLCLSWCAAALPFGMAIVFASVATEAPDRLNAMLASLYGATGVTAALAVALASWPTSAWRVSLVEAFSMIWFEVQAATLRWYGWGLSICLLLSLGKASIDLLSGQNGAFVVVLAPVAVLVAAIAAVYGKASTAAQRGLARRGDRIGRSSRRKADVAWLCLAALGDAVRLWSLVWFLRATSVLPFFDDVAGLGGALQAHGDFVAVEMERIWTEEFSWLLRVGLICLLWSGFLAAVTLSLRSMRLARPEQAAASPLAGS